MKPTRPLIIAALLLWMAHHASADPPPAQAYVNLPVFLQAEAVSPYTIRVPFRLAGHLIVVQAAVEGQAGNFILDTGSSDLILNDRHYSGGYAKDNYASLGTNGQVSSVRTRKVDEMQWDSINLQKVYADLIDLNHIEQKKNIRLLGLIGYSVLKEYEILIDFQLSQITLTLTDRQGNRIDPYAYAETPVDSAGFRLKSHIAVLDGTVGGESVQFGLDSGAELNLLDKRVNRSVLDHFEISKRVLLNGMEGESVEVIAGKLYHYRLQEQRCSPMRTILTDMSALNRAFRTRLDGLLGYEFFSERRTIINYKKEKLYFLKWHRP